MAKKGPTPKLTTKKHIARLERERQQVRLIRGIAIAGIIVVLLLLGYGYLQLNYFQLREPVAEVNGEIIMTGDWQERVRFERVNLLNRLNLFQYYQQFGMDTTQQIQQITLQLQSPDILGQQVLDQMIDEALIRQEAEQRGITVTDEEVEKAIQETNGFFPNGTPTPTITPTEFSTPTLSPKQLTIYPPTSTPTEAPTSTPEPTSTPDRSVTATPTSTTAPPTPTFVPEAATATATPYTLEGFQADFEKSLKDFKSYGISEDTLRSIYMNDLLRRKLLDEIAKDAPHTEEQVWARHILVDDAKTAQTVRILLFQGVDFAEAAADFSKDTGSAASGGDLGWFGKGAMVAEFEEAAFSQEIGEIGQAVKSQFGYHIIQVIARQELPLTASQYEQKRESIFAEWLTAKRQEGTDAGTVKILDVWKEQVPSEPAQLNTPTA